MSARSELEAHSGCDVDREPAEAVGQGGEHAECVGRLDEN